MAGPSGENGQDGVNGEPGKEDILKRNQKTTIFPCENGISFVETSCSLLPSIFLTNYTRIYMKVWKNENSVGV